MFLDQDKDRMLKIRHSGRRLVIRCRLGYSNACVDAMVDTGSTFCVIPNRLWEIDDPSRRPKFPSDQEILQHMEDRKIAEPENTLRSLRTARFGRLFECKPGFVNLAFPEWSRKSRSFVLERCIAKFVMGDLSGLDATDSQGKRIHNKKTGEIVKYSEIPSLLIGLSAIQEGGLCLNLASKNDCHLVGPPGWASRSNEPD